MTAALRFVYLLALVVWLGAVVFFSFVVAPAVFTVLGPERAGDVVAVVFPRYYLLGMAAAGTALVAAWALRRGAVARHGWTGALLALGVGLAATAWAGLIVEPRARALRAERVAVGRQEPGDEFRRVHRLAVGLNAVALLAGLTALGCSAAALRH